MAGEWREKTIDQLGRIITGKTPDSTESKYFGGDIPFVTPTDFDGRRVIASTGRYLTTHGAEAVRGARVPPRAVMVSCIGSDMGKAAVADRECVTNQQINSIVIESDDDPLFVYYNLSIRKEEIRAAAGGSAQPILNKSAFGRLDIGLPPPEEQRAIAHILGALDDKIELNRRMSETLDAMARALFKAWFVDFEPVRAKHALSKVEGIEGRWQRGQSLPGLPTHLYDLFPDRLVDSSLGAIPQGWEVKIIDDLAEIIGGSTPSTVQPAYWDDGIHCWATPKDLSALKAPVLLNTERRVTDAGLAQISSGLLPKGTVLLSSRAPIGYLAIAEVPVAINQGFVAMKPRTGVPNLFLLLWARAAHEDILARANGSTFLEISKANFRPLRVVGPPLSVLNAFDRIARPMYERIVFIERESNALATLRDTLLPMLISGELRLKNAAWLAEVAA